jgi:hypothetical protein
MLRDNDVKFRGKCRIVNGKLAKSRAKKSGNCRNISDNYNDNEDISEIEQ